MTDWLIAPSRFRALQRRLEAAFSQEIVLQLQRCHLGVIHGGRPWSWQVSMDGGLTFTRVGSPAESRAEVDRTLVRLCETAEAAL